RLVERYLPCTRCPLLHALEVGETERLAEYTRLVQHLARRGGKMHQSLPDDGAYTDRHLELIKSPHLPAPVRPGDVAALHQRAHHLLDEERNPGGVCMQEVH